MKEIRITENIVLLRKKKGVTQEQMATALNISPQAVSKWETGASQPDVQTLPLIADYFGVSIDYLFYGEDIIYDDIFDKVYEKVRAHPQMSRQSFEDALRLFGYAHHGISCGNLRGRKENGVIYDSPAYISNENGVSLLMGKGYGAIVTRTFFEGIDRGTADFAEKILPLLADKTTLLVCMAIVSMSDISYSELKEKLGLSDKEQGSSLIGLIDAGLVIETKSKHQSLGYTYEINERYHACLCLLIATLQVQRDILEEGYSCCAGYGDFPISF